jgi:hypothetical protein
MKHYIFGYGSLMNTRSRLKTANTNKAIPVRVNGIQRAWNFHNPERKRNVLGAVFKENSTCNGVLVMVPEENLKKFDDREIGYNRVELQLDIISPLNGHSLPKGKIWMYSPSKLTLPAKDSPIQQSYIDVVISGCLEFGEDFAEECINSSLFWNYHWIDDRKNPGYPRTLRNLPIEEIDKILKKFIPEAFKIRVKLEE